MAVLLLVRFLAELGLVAGLAWGGYHLGHRAGVVPGLVLAVLLPAVGIAIWGRWIAPRAPRRLRDPQRSLVEFVLFAGTFMLLTGSDPDAIPAALLLVFAYLISMPSRHVEL